MFRKRWEVGRDEWGWLALSLVTLVVNVLVAASVPFFASFQNLIGSSTGAPIMLAWPSFFLFTREFSQRRRSADVGTRTLLCDDLCGDAFLYSVGNGRCP